MIAPLLEQIGANRSQLEGIVRSELQRLPKVSGGSPPQPSSELVRVLEAAQREADAMKDEFVSTEHLVRCRQALVSVLSEISFATCDRVLVEFEAFLPLPKVSGGSPPQPSSELAACWRPPSAKPTP